MLLLQRYASLHTSRPKTLALSPEAILAKNPPSLVLALLQDRVHGFPRLWASLDPLRPSFPSRFNLKRLNHQQQPPATTELFITLLSVDTEKHSNRRYLENSPELTKSDLQLLREVFVLVDRSKRLKRLRILNPFEKVPQTKRIIYLTTTKITSFPKKAFAQRTDLLTMMTTWIISSMMAVAGVAEVRLRKKGL